MNNFAKGSEFGKQTATSVPGPWAALSLCLSGNAVTKEKVCVCCSEVVLQPREVWHLCWYWYSLHTCVIRSIFCLFLGKLEKNTPQIWPVKDIWTSGVDCQQLNFYSVTWPLCHAVKLIVTSLVIFLPASFRPISLHSADIKYHWLSVILVCRCCHATHLLPISASPSYSGSIQASIFISPTSI